MPLTIKDSKPTNLASRRAGVTGETLTQDARRAIDERLPRAPASCDGASAADELDRIALHCASLPKWDGRSADEIIEYNERGVPR